MTSRHYIGFATPDATKRYASDLNDREFALIAPYVIRLGRSAERLSLRCGSIVPLQIRYRLATVWLLSAYHQSSLSYKLASGVF